MSRRSKHWAHTCLAAGLIGAMGLSGCDEAASGPSGPVPAVPAASVPDVDAGPVGVQDEAQQAALDPALLLPVDERAVLMAAQVVAGAALARAGAPEDAASHLRRAITEIKPGGLARLEQGGLDPMAFEAAAAALDAGAASDETEAKLEAVEANISLLRANAGGDPAALIAYMMKHCRNAYRAGVSIDNQVQDPAEYQDAYGYAIVAQDLAGRLEADAADDVRLELKMLVLMWPGEGPRPGELPAPLITFMSQVNRVTLALSALQ